jgi:cytochrome c
MWSLSTNNVLGGIIAAIALIFIADNIGDLAIPPYEPVVEKQTAEKKATPSKSAEKKADVPAQSLGALLASASVDRGKKVAKKCASCHTFNKGGKNKIGPNLFAIIGRDRGSVDGYGYSGAMKKFGGNLE